MFAISLNLIVSVNQCNYENCRSMNQKDKQLLLRDLCSRLPYGVVLSVGIFSNGDMRYLNQRLDYHKKLLSLIELDGHYYFNGHLCKHTQFTAKPYLRSMSSMTEDERNKYNDIVKNTIDFYDCPKSEDVCFFIIPIDWLNAHHFDYRGLIEKGLAIEVTPENNPYK